MSRRTVIGHKTVTLGPTILLHFQRRNSTLGSELFWAQLSPFQPVPPYGIIVVANVIIGLKHCILGTFVCVSFVSLVRVLEL